MTDQSTRAMYTPPPEPRRRGGEVGQFFQKYALIFVTIAVAVFFAFTPPASNAFLTINNFNVVLGNNTVTSLIALASLFPLICGFFDFSLGASAIFIAVLCAGMQVKYGWPLWLSIVVPLLVSVVIGVINGLFVMKLKMDPFVTTLGMATLLSGLTIWFCAGTTFVMPGGNKLVAFGSTRWFGLPAVFFLLLLCAALIWYFFRHTPYGRSLYAIGSNSASARLVGVRVDRNVWWAFIISSVISGVAGLIYLSRVGSATAIDGGSLLFAALAAVFLGATAITPGFFNVIGTIISAIFVSIAVSGLTLMGASGWATNVFDGAALLLAVALSTYLGRRNKRG